MKLKRIISALVVFTMVMACAVCSVSADATYNVYTSYNVGTGEVTVNAAIAGATDGSMVSYIIYGGDSVEESTIVHLDQATVADGVANFDAVTTDFDDFNSKKVKFVSTDDTLTRSTNSKKTHEFVESVNTFSDIQRSVVFISGQTNGGPVKYSYIKDGVPYYVGSTSTNTGKVNWAYAEGMEAYDMTTFPKEAAVMPIEDVDAYITQFGTRANRDSYQRIRFRTEAGNFSGRTGQGVVDPKNYLYESEKSSMLIGGAYKEDITDGTFAGITLKGGDIISAWIDNVPGHANASASYKDNANTVLYMTVDAAPVVGKYTNHNGEFDAVTFLCTPAAEAADYEKGLNIYRYELKANSADEIAGLELIASVPSAAEANGRFGIQLFDGTNEGELDATKYGFLAAPYIVIDGEKKELSVFGDNGVGAAPEEGQVKGDVFYYENSVNQTATAK